MGGGKGGSDFDPKGKSDAEVIRFCKAFMNKLTPYVGSGKDVPAGDIGVGGREIRAMYEEYVKVTGKHDCSLTGKPLDLGGSLCRTEATGYGLCYIANEALTKISNSSFKGKTVIVSGSGNVATYAAEKAIQLGAKVLAMSDSTNAIYDKDGIDIKIIKQIKEGHRGRIKEYLADRPETVLMNPKDIWGIKANIVLPCATQFEIDIDDAKKIVSGGATIVAEGANMPCTKEASRYFIDNDVIYLPGKASNAGGVAVSGLEMIQNANHEHWSFEEVNQRLKTIMVTIFHNVSETARDFGSPNDFVMGANTYSFIIIQKE
jgi:glutamate dehydrogenase (NADP+)